MSDVELMRAEMAVIAEQLKRIEDHTDPGAKDEKPKGMLERLAAIAIAIVAIGGVYGMWQGWSKDSISITNSKIETEISREELELTKLKTVELIRRLNDEDPEDLLGRSDDTRALLTEINASVDALQKVQNSISLGALLIPFVFIWAAFSFLNIAQSVVGTFWSYITVAVHAAIRSMIDYGKQRTLYGRLAETTANLAIGQAPHLFFLFVRVALFTGMVLPFLLHLAALSPDGATLQDFTDAMTSYRPFEAIRTFSGLFNFTGGGY